MSNSLLYKAFYRRNLPHIQPPGATFFLTARLVDTIPAHIGAEVRDAMQAELRAAEQLATVNERDRRRYEAQKRAFGRTDDWLGRATAGPTWLSQPEIANLVAAAIHHRDGREYDLIAFTIMPNHVHLLITPLERDKGTYYALPRINHSLKRYTANRANRLLGRQGRFWQQETYDHIVRDEAERQRITTYILQNPVKAGLCATWEEWPWTYLQTNSAGSN